MEPSFVKLILEWLKGQPFSNVISFLQLGMICGAIYMAIYVLIPSERIAILDGLKQQENQHTEQINRVTESFERALDRFSGRTVADQRQP